MKNFIFIFSFLFMAFQMAFSQEETPEMLVQQLQESEDTVRISILFRIAKLYTIENPTATMEYSAEGISQAKKHNQPLYEAKFLNLQGLAYYYLNSFDESTQKYFESLQVFDSLKYDDGSTRALNNIAWNLRVQGDHEKSITYFLKALDLAIKLDDQQLTQGIYNNLGTAYRYINEKQKALEVYQKSLVINQELGNKTWEAYNFNNIGLIYYDLKDFQLSKNNFVASLRINLEIYNPKEYAKNYLNLGHLYTDFNRLDSAEFLLDIAKKIIDKNDLKAELQTYYDYKKEYFARKGDYKKAYEFQDLFYDLDKELNRTNLESKITDVQAKYELDQKEKELALNASKLKQQKLIILGGLILFILMLGVLVLLLILYRSKNSYAKDIEKLNREINLKAEQLKTVNDEIKNINNNLEKLVDERTKKVNSKNEQLLKYAFINSHEIRGPLARVMGLLYLLQLENGSLKSENTFRLLSDATHELDSVIKKASELLVDEDFFMNEPPIKT